jgi:Phosphoenolpyruvate carboxylase
MAFDKLDMILGTCFAYQIFNCGTNSHRRNRNTNGRRNLRLGGALNPKSTVDPPIDEDLPLREDIRLLGRFLGETLREQEGEAAFNRIEHIRPAAVRFRRNGDLQARDQLEATLRSLSQDVTVWVARAFTYFSQLSNLAEDLHYNRRRRAHQLAGSPPRKAVCRLPWSGWLRLRRRSCGYFLLQLRNCKYSRLELTLSTQSATKYFSAGWHGTSITRKI